MKSLLTHLECSKTGEHYDADVQRLPVRDPQFVRDLGEPHQKGKSVVV